LRVCLDLGDVFHPGASDDDNAQALQALLECLVTINRVYLRRHPRTPKLYDSGVRYVRTQVWDSIPDLLARRYGDCKSLTAMLVAELRQQGEQAKPVFRFARNPHTHQKDFHILVWRGGKDFEDPSRRLGMDEYHRRQGIWAFPS
jgi:hypothetical protein